MYVTSFGDSIIYKVTPAGVKTIVCRQIPSPVGIVVDLTANFLYVSSLVTNRIYQLDITQSFPIILTSQNNFVGSEDGIAGSADGVGTAATFRLVFGMTIDANQTMYVTDYGNNSIRKIVISTRLVTTIAGSTTGVAGNTIPYPLTNAIETNAGNDARFNKPTGIVADNLGNLFVCDSRNFAIRRIIILTNDIIYC
jgi:sugar lactone lactonase YvrE